MEFVLLPILFKEQSYHEKEAAGLEVDVYEDTYNKKVWFNKNAIVSLTRDLDDEKFTRITAMDGEGYVCYYDLDKVKDKLSIKK